MKEHLLSFRAAESLSSSLLSKNIETEMWRNIILSVVLYGCEIWSLILREEHKLRVSENRVLRKIFGYWIYRSFGKNLVPYLKGRLIIYPGVRRRSVKLRHYLFMFRVCKSMHHHHSFIHFI